MLYFEYNLIEKYCNFRPNILRGTSLQRKRLIVPLLIVRLETAFELKKRGFFSRVYFFQIIPSVHRIKEKKKKHDTFNKDLCKGRSTSCASRVNQDSTVIPFVTSLCIVNVTH